MDARARAEEFERLRPYLLRVAYSHLGSISEAEDVVQEAWLRLQRAAGEEVADLRAWMTKTVSRLAVDALTSARARRETYVGTWLPEPVVSDQALSGDPGDRITLDESVSMALLVVLESLTPAERAAFLLHDVFGYRFAEVAEIVGRSPEAVRQLAARARRSVRARRPRNPASARQEREVVEAFLQAAVSGDVQRLLALLDPGVRYRSDGGGVVPAARQALVGADRVASALASMGGRSAGTFEATIADVNGTPGLVVESEGELSVVAFTIDGLRITEIHAIRNPRKLSHLRRSRQWRH